MKPQFVAGTVNKDEYKEVQYNCKRNRRSIAHRRDKKKRWGKIVIEETVGQMVKTYL